MARRTTPITSTPSCRLGTNEDRILNMKQFKVNRLLIVNDISLAMNVDEVITQHNALCDYLEEWHNQAVEQAEVHEIEVGKKTITLPKPWWWNLPDQETGVDSAESYKEALEAASKASGIRFLLED